MLVSFVSVAILWFKFKHKTKIWEFLIPFVATFIFALIMNFFTSLVTALKDEYWTGWITKSEYYEDWNELVHYTEQEACGTDSDGNTIYRTVHKTRVDYHSPYWVAYGSNGEEYSIDSDQYRNFVRRWGNQKFKDMRRDYYTDDGDMYYVDFDRQDAHIEVISSVHLYQNKVAVSRSVFNYPEVDKKTIKQYGLYSYPKLTGQWDMPCVLGPSIPGSHLAEKTLSIFNAKRGATAKVRVWLLIFKDQPLDAAIQQQNYWKNGNMNEFVICVGVDSKDKVTWGHAFSWTDVTALPIEARNLVNDQIDKKANLAEITSWVDKNLTSRWIKKNFKKDFAYISVSPPWWAVLITILFAAGVNYGLIVWIVQNEFSDDMGGSSRGSYSRVPFRIHRY